MSEILQPTPNQTIIRTHDEHRRGDEHHIVNAILREQAAGFRTAATDHTATIGTIKDTRHDVSSDVKTAATAAALASCKTDDAIGALGKDVTQSTQVGFSALGVQIASTTNALGIQADKNAGDLTVQATANYNLGQQNLQSAFNALTVQATLNRNDILLDSTKNAAASILFAEQKAAAATLLATTLAATAAAQLAECCCELRAGQIAQADRVIGVIQGNELADLRARMARLIQVAPAGTVV